MLTFVVIKSTLSESSASMLSLAKQCLTDTVTMELRSNYFQGGGQMSNFVTAASHTAIHKRNKYIKRKTK